jgi:5'-phosphate synthase pdxT subunit
MAIYSALTGWEDCILERQVGAWAGQKEGGQSLLGGLDCLVHRNFFGAQINSFETELPAPRNLPAFQSGPEGFRAMFIRAPAVLEAGPSVEVLSEYR